MNSNPEQKIKHISKLKEENNKLKEEKIKLTEANEKLNSIIMEIEKDTKNKDSKKRNLLQEKIAIVFKIFGFF